MYYCIVIFVIYCIREYEINEIMVIYMSWWELLSFFEIGLKEFLGE